MPTESADALIQWANKLPDARFCLLEQLLPEGMKHPFAQTMMAHFDKLGTPLGACKKYPTVAAQDTRFRSLGWPSVLVRNLWELWGAEGFLDSKERIALDSIEPFDEWEEFALFGSIEESSERTSNALRASYTKITYSEYPKVQGQRRFAAPLWVRNGSKAQDVIGNFSGMGLNTRVSSCDIYSTDELGFTSFDSQCSQSWPSSRMCHTITEIDDSGSLLVGGRTSPDNAMADCWFYHKLLNTWERVDDLPQPRYRQSAVHLGNGYVMVAGGKSGPRYGIVAGGISEDGLVQEDVWDWELRDIAQHKEAQPSIRFKLCSLEIKDQTGATPARFGAQTLMHQENFDRILDAGKPVILEGLDVGLCIEKWTPEYLKDKIGAEREVVVHEASSEHMSFSSKNFGGSKLYLRSLSAEKASELPADIVKDYPAVSADFQLPPELVFVSNNVHSSPLRISGPVNMWLHYDVSSSTVITQYIRCMLIILWVMANVLCQVRGSKRLLLFPPSDVKYFDFAPGASSSGINVFESLGDLSLSQTHPHEVLLQPGDVLFLPSLWLHTASPTSGMSVAVNVFFRNLRNGYAAGKDVYGNRDLQAYEKGRQDIAKIARSFESLPTDVRGFYMQRLADEFMQKIT
ncbi:hypothetical protein DID88_007964 [Monilinia fructigena]|uniref:JmjC domain-containing protein n=1 Tax=Monilinia fructigena TaxID=38457 RepID=A0A395J3X2_9HELO|nr:hypothetical protein DID88_007964 [Monilinia fructigena]